MITHFLKKAPLTLLLFCFIAAQASAVVVTGPDDGRTIPTGLPLGNVGQRGGASGVYLDNGWVLTAGHVSAGDITFGDTTYSYDGTNNIRLQNPDGYDALESTYTDLRLFHLTEEPNLPILTIPNVSPGVGQEIYYAGYGTKTSETLKYWTYSEADGWNETDNEYARYWGYELTGPEELNWGRNRILASGNNNNGPTDNTFYVELQDGTNHIALATQIQYTEGDAGAVSGDSGGAAFYYDDIGTGEKAWMLAGIMSCIGHPKENPPTQALADTYTFSVALSFYHDQIHDIIYPETIPGDANGDGRVDGSDVTILANNWHKTLTGTEEECWAAGDFNGDGFVDASDVTILAGNWQYGVEGQVSVTSDTNLAVPEPSTLLLMLIGVATTFPFLLSRKFHKP